MGENIGRIHIEPLLGLVGLELTTLEKLWKFMFDCGIMQLNDLSFYHNAKN